MFKSLFSSLVLFFLINSFLFGQESYFIKKASFNSEENDEFSPVFYKEGIVFCSNMFSNVFNYSTSQNKALFKIAYADTLINLSRGARLFSDDLNSRLNDGPVTFSRNGDTIYFSRNLMVEGNMRSASGIRNRLGIFYAVLEGEKWTNIRELRFNNDSYNVTTPYLSPDHKRLYFASDKPDGYGGSDLYYCNWNETYWSNPINLGPVINTPGNEAFPFVNQNGELFFSSDSHPGLGKKDIFFSKFVETEWIEPVRLDAPINSPDDDFGFLSDAEMNEGYFSSDRGRSVDIYQFKTLNPQFLYCENQKINQTCFSFTDDMKIDIDPINLQFQWDFGDGKKETGYVVEHCFPGPGKYKIKQDVIDKKTGKVVFNKLSYEIEIKSIKQPYISGDEVVVAGSQVSLNASKSNLPDIENISYHWEFGDGATAKGESVGHIYKTPGEYIIKLGLTGNNSGRKKQVCVSRMVTVTSDLAEKNARSSKEIKKAGMPGIEEYDDAVITKLYSSADAISAKSVFQVEIISSATKLSLKSGAISNLVPKYKVREIYYPDAKLYSYIIDEGITFMELYPTLKDALALNFSNARIITYIPLDNAEKELWNLKRLYGSSSDDVFPDGDTDLKQGSNKILDQLSILLKKFPELRIEIAVHSDNSGTPATNLLLTRKRAQSIAGYLIGKGVNSNRLISTGYGDLRPVASNYSESERKKNRRIDFIKMN